jgi:predicted nucleic acid-binding protein
MLKWTLLVEEGRKIGHTFSQPDLIIAATAQHYDLTIVSRDTSPPSLRRARGAAKLNVLQISEVHGWKFLLSAARRLHAVVA